MELMPQEDAETWPGGVKRGVHPIRSAFRLLETKRSVAPMASSLLTMTDEPDHRVGVPWHDADRFSVFGVSILNVAEPEVIGWIDEAIHDRQSRLSVFFVNAHTLNLAAKNPLYRQVLNSSGCVLGDGTGVRWAARLHGIRVRENLNGTDLTPQLFETTAGHGHSYFLLGADEETIAKAACHAGSAFPGWRLVGHHHGYLADESLNAATIERINAARPDLLLVGMGNPLQEQWIARYRLRLDVPVCMGVGGLFDFWAGSVRRAPKWMRKAGYEWLWRLYQQPRQKAARYLVGNPAFLARAVWERAAASKNE